MVQVPTTPRNSVEVQPLDRTPFRYNPPRDQVSPAIERLGATMRQSADDLDQIEAAYDQADVLNGDNTFAAEASDLASEFKNLKGDAPGRNLQDYLKRLGDRETELVSAARSERARNIMRRTLSVRRSNIEARLTEHSDAEMFKYRDAALVAGRDQAALDAQGAVGTPQFEVAIGTGLMRIEERAKLAGLPDEVVALEKQKFYDEVHGGVLDGLFAAPIPDVDTITAYVESRGREISPALKNETLARLQKPLQGRITRADSDLVAAALGDDALTAGTRPAIDPSGVGEWQSVAVNVANAFNLDPSDVAAVMSYETAGTFNPNIKGGKGGNYLGLIQFGPSERAKYGIREGSSPAEWTRAITSFLTDRGFKKGMGVLDLYSTINAGTPGRYGASDGNGTVRGHVDKILADHKTKAIGWLGQAGAAYDSAPREWDRTKVNDAIEATAEREGWSPERTELVRAEWDRRIQRDEGLFKDEQNAAGERATEVVQALGDNFKSISQIPGEVWNKLSPSDKIAWQKVAEANSKPVEPQANGQAVMTLNLMRYYEPEKFKGLNLAQYAGQVTRAELDTLLTTQAQMRTKPEGAATWNPRSGIVTALNYGKKINQLDLEPADEAAILQIMEAEANRLHAANGGKPLTENDYQALFKSATRGVKTVKSTFGISREGSVPRFQLELSNMPDSQRKRLTSQFQRSMGRAPTEDELLRLYRVSQ